MFEYTFTSSDNAPTILTPFANSMSDIKKEVTQTTDCIRNISTYPNGVILDMEQYSDKTIIKCNHELVKNDDGTYSINI